MTLESTDCTVCDRSVHDMGIPMGPMGIPWEWVA